MGTGGREGERGLGEGREGRKERPSAMVMWQRVGAGRRSLPLSVVPARRRGLRAPRPALPPARGLSRAAAVNGPAARLP